jgi:type II secretory pathway component HofQ
MDDFLVQELQRIQMMLVEIKVELQEKRDVFNKHKKSLETEGFQDTVVKELARLREERDRCADHLTEIMIKKRAFEALVKKRNSCETDTEVEDGDSVSS